MIVGYPQFLSRLCGGEGINPAFAAIPLFLSRLCGGEVLWVVAAVRLIFLSRLCGGEDTILALGFIAILSKPPMWR